MNIDKKAVEILNETLNKHEHRMADALFGSTELMVLDAIKTAINYTRCSTQLLCVEKGDDNGITRGYEYKCINQDKDHYKIIDNYGYENWFLKEYFTKIE